MNIEHPYIIPNWSAPKGVQALMTTRLGGISQAPYESMNLGTNTHDQIHALEHNKNCLKGWVEHRSQRGVILAFLEQVHGVDAIDLDVPSRQKSIQKGLELTGDASFCTTSGTVCIVRVADCMPVLLAVSGGVAAIHAGWRGLAAGIVTQTLHRLLQATRKSVDDVVVWLGPCIGAENFEVGEDVKNAFEKKDTQNACAFLQGVSPNKWLADLPKLGQLELRRCGVKQIYVDGRCTVKEESLFYSYRRDQQKYGDTGRMAACVWLSDD